LYFIWICFWKYVSPSPQKNLTNFRCLNVFIPPLVLNPSESPIFNFFKLYRHHKHSCSQNFVLIRQRKVGLKLARRFEKKKNYFLFQRMFVQLPKRFMWKYECRKKEKRKKARNLLNDERHFWESVRALTISTITSHTKRERRSRYRRAYRRFPLWTCIK